MGFVKPLDTAIRFSALLTALLIVWQLLASQGYLSNAVLPPPLKIAEVAFSLAASGVLFENSLGSIHRVFVGFSLAAIAGIAFGVSSLLFSQAGRFFTPFVDLLRPIPPIAWIPLAILWFGLGDQSAVFIVFIGAFFPIALNSAAGIGNVSKVHIDAARCLGAKRRLIVTDVLLPAAAPQVLVGLRLGLANAWTSVIAAEMVGARNGLGYAIQLNRTMLEMEAVMVNMAVIGLIGWTMNWGVRQLERELTRWNLDTVDMHARGRKQAYFG